MLLHGKDDGSTRKDLWAFAEAAGMCRPRARALLEQATNATARWHDFAAEAEVAPKDVIRIGGAFRQL